MKKVYMALMCLAALSMTTACSGDKKADKASDNDENKQEVVSDDTKAGDSQEADNQEANEQEDADNAEARLSPADAKAIDLAAVYAKDFKPATTVIFEDTLGDETVGELPSKWDIRQGSAEVAEAAGHKFIALSGGECILLPVVGEKVFLPESYTVEFQFLFGMPNWYHVEFFNADDWEISRVNFSPADFDWGVTKTDESYADGRVDNMASLLNKNGWNHFAMSFDKGNMKLFINGKRIANLPNVSPAAYFVIDGQETNGESHYITNIRVAK